MLAKLVYTSSNWGFPEVLCIGGSPTSNWGHLHPSVTAIYWDLGTINAWFFEHVLPRMDKNWVSTYPAEK